MIFDFSVFGTADAWISLITLSFLEIILGVDNIIFISLIAGKLPKQEQKRARLVGLSLALIMRLILLTLIGWVIGLTAPMFTLPLQTIFETLGVENAAAAAAISGRDLILILGGFFLLAKSTTEIHGKVNAKEEKHQPKGGTIFWSIILQIVLIDIVFSFDSILTAVGLTKHVIVMMVAVVISIIVMMFFAGAISDFINKYPTLQILALSFLIMIGLTLILEGFEAHVNKAFVYVSVIFSLFVEFLNIRFRSKNVSA
ncbi:MAG: TerC family protein [Chitinophagales bacterium]|nr:TerC family protein [Chitinophagales bacterium]